MTSENKIREIVKIECEKMYPEFLQRDCNDLLVILAGRLQIALTQYHQDMMSDLMKEFMELDGTIYNGEVVVRAGDVKNIIKLSK